MVLLFPSGVKASNMRLLVFIKEVFMSYESAKAQLERHQLADRVRLFTESSATVELAAQVLGCEPGNIAKTLSFLGKDNPLIVVAAGDAKVDNRKFKDTFLLKAKMIPREEVEALTGHPAGGVCPFGLKTGCKVYLDQSLKRFEKIFPACGTAQSAVELSIDELEKAAEPVGWVNVCKD